jgi:2-polyprenyl-6-methoxyphenol hydroxylase-like FAD-dependent oxidoreductase
MCLRRLIASEFRDRSAFIAGDAAHIGVSYAGYGMNTGIADAMNLSWLLAAVARSPPTGHQMPLLTACWCCRGRTSMSLGTAIACRPIRLG